MRDQSYIAGVGRQVEETGRNLVQDKVIPQGRGAGRDGKEAEQNRLDERSDKEDRMVREARNEGVELILLPKGMSKRLKNGTRWDQKCVCSLLYLLSASGLTISHAEQKQPPRMDC
jgi:hypothetical protein